MPADHVRVGVAKVGGDVGERDPELAQQGRADAAPRSSAEIGEKMRGVNRVPNQCVGRRHYRGPTEVGLPR